MDLRKIKTLIELVKTSGINEIEIKEGEESVRISLHGGTSAPAAIVHQVSTALPPAVAPESSSPSTEAPTAELTGHVVRSPMVGTLYLAPSPTADPFVAVGQKVKLNDVLCIVEAMKMFNQIETDMAGTIKTRLVENGQAVEYGQPLFIIEES